MSQTCSKCLLLLPIEKFSKQAKAKNGYRKVCKDCHNKYVREVWYAKNADKQKAAVREWESRNKTKVLAKRYNTTEEVIQELLDRGVCDVCGDGDNLCIDHCHATGVVRGILCRGCNHGLGNFRDDVELMHDAIKYLNRSVRR